MLWCCKFHWDSGVRDYENVISVIKKCTRFRKDVIRLRHSSSKFGLWSRPPGLCIECSVWRVCILLWMSLAGSGRVKFWITLDDHFLFSTWIIHGQITVIWIITVSMEKIPIQDLYWPTRLMSPPLLFLSTLFKSWIQKKKLYFWDTLWIIHDWIFVIFI